ncbi:MAG: hypothetical protein P8N68_05105 [Paracoccaceae bacterium]|jgi:hypothetical protein|nr:hypothetical protein [Paracoccaceae bacterium]
MLRFSHRPTSTLAVVLMLALAGPAAAYRPNIPLDVVPLGDPGAFEVIESRGAGPSHIWCVAADHAYRVLGAAGTDRIYLVAPRGPSQSMPDRKAVGFAMSPAQANAVPAAAKPFLGGLLLAQMQAGSSLGVAQALQYCTDHIETD